MPKNKKGQKQAKPKSKTVTTTEESDALASKLLSMEGQPKDNVQWRTREVMAAALCPHLVDNDKALLEERKSCKDEARIAEIKGEQKAIKRQMSEIIFEAYPNLKEMIERCPSKDRDGSGGAVGRPRKAKAPADFVKLAVANVQTAQKELDEIVGEPAKALREAEAVLAKAMRDAEKSGERKAKLDERIAGLQAKIAELTTERANLENAVSVTEAQKAVDKAKGAVEKKLGTKAAQAAQEKVDALNKQMVKIAEAAAAGKPLSLVDDKIVIG